MIHYCLVELVLNVGRLFGSLESLVRLCDDHVGIGSTAELVRLLLKS